MGEDAQSGAQNPSRRQLLLAIAAAAGVGGALIPSAVRAQTGYVVRTREQHAALPIVWGYPFAQRVDRRRGVDGYPVGPYPQDTYANHKGVDYYASPRVGSRIHAVADGQVTVVNQLDSSALGAYVRVTHADGVYSEYGHMTPNSILVSVGQQVLRGQPLGLTGWTGQIVPKDASNAHLHLTIQSWASGLVIWNPLWLVEDAPLAGEPPPMSDDVGRSAVRVSADGLSQALPAGTWRTVAFDGGADADLALVAGGPGICRISLAVDYAGLVPGRSVELQLLRGPSASAERAVAAYSTAGIAGGVVVAEYESMVVIPAGHSLLLSAKASAAGVTITRLACRTLTWQATP